MRILENMADLDTLYAQAKSSVAPLKKIIASQGKNSGTFYFVKGNKKGESGIVIFLQKRDKKGAKALSSGKALKKASGGKKFSVGTVKMEDSKLIFRVKKGSAKSSVVQKSFKQDFLEDDFKAIGILLKRARVLDGEATIEEAAEEEMVVEDLDEVGQGEPEEPTETFSLEEMEAMQNELEASIKGADAETREELRAILDAEEDYASDMTNLDEIYIQLLQEEIVKDEMTYTDIEEGDIVAVIEEMYRSDMYSIEEMQEYAVRIANKGVDLSVFEKKASVGQKIPEPLRSQILLSTKINQLQVEMAAAQDNFPANIKELLKGIIDAVNAQNAAISANLNGRDDDDMKAIGKYIGDGKLFASYPSDLQKALDKIKTVKSGKAIEGFQKKFYY